MNLKSTLFAAVAALFVSSLAVGSAIAPATAAGTSSAQAARNA